MVQPRTERSERVGGPDGSRTRDLMNAIHARSQLRYWPTRREPLSLAQSGPVLTVQLNRSVSSILSAVPRNLQTRAQQSTCSGVFSGSQLLGSTRRSNR